MKKQPISGALANEEMRSPYAFYYTVSSYLGKVYDIWDGNSWSVLNLPASANVSKGTTLKLTKFNDVIIAYGHISSFNNVTPPTGKYFGFLQYKNGVWDTLPGGILDSSVNGYYNNSTAATTQDLYYMSRSGGSGNNGYIYHYDTANRRFVKIIDFVSNSNWMYLKGGKNRLLITNVSKINGTATNGFACIDSDTIRLNSDNKFGEYMMYGIDMYNDHIFALNYTSNPTVLEYDRQLVQSRSTTVNAQGGSNGDIQAYNGKVIWMTFNSTYSYIHYHNILCSGSNVWARITMNNKNPFFTNPNVTKSGIYTKNSADRITYELNTGSILKGIAYIDADSNCTWDTLNEPLLKDRPISVKSKNFRITGMTDDSGKYEVYIYPDTLEFEGPGPMSACASKTEIMLTPASVNIKNIPLFKPTKHNLKLRVLDGFSVRWNNHTFYHVELENTGLPSDSAHFEFKFDPKIKLIYGDSNVTFLSNASTRGTIKNLGYYDKRVVGVVAWIDSAKTKPDSILCHHYEAWLYGNESDSTDNTGNICQRVVYSRDPNYKECDKAIIPVAKSSALQYYIGFQNEGNDDAYDVVLSDSLSKSLDLETFKVIGASHPYTLTIQDRVLKITFKDIHLKPKKVDEALSQGFFKFSINTVKNLINGFTIPNKAYIYFDLNQPVITNTSIVKVSDAASVVSEIKNNTGTLQIYPNPALTTLNIKTNETAPVMIYAINGELIYSGQTINGLLTVDMSGWANGLYLVRCGNFSSKVIKAE